MGPKKVWQTPLYRRITKTKIESKEAKRLNCWERQPRSRAYTHLSRPWCMFSHRPLSRSLSRTHTGSCRGCSHRSVSTPSRYCWHIHQCLTQEQRVKVWGMESWQSAKDVIFTPRALWNASVRSAGETKFDSNQINTSTVREVRPFKKPSRWY